MSESRFTSQASTEHDRLQAQAHGLLDLSEYRKRHAEVERSSNAVHDESRGATSSQPGDDATRRHRSATPQTQVKRKKKRKAGKGKLSFADDDDEEDDGQALPASKWPRSITRESPATEEHGWKEDGTAEQPPIAKRRLGPNASIANAPKILTKSVLLKEAQAREELRKEFVTMQEAVKAAEITIPFVFYDGTHVLGGSCCVRKGDHIWVFLDKCRKLGAELALGGSGEAKNRREWARVGVDDLMLVRGEIIIPHHYEFYYFIVNKFRGYDGLPIFPYSAEPPTGPRSHEEGRPMDMAAAGYNPLSRPSERLAEPPKPPPAAIEGAGEDPNVTKVVNRSWYERNKHIFPASTWEEFDPAKDYTTAMRRDAQGNSFFFSR